MILKLYDLHREAVMRQARSLGGNICAKIGGRICGGDQERRGGNRLPAAGVLYWDMVGAFVKHRFLSETWLYDTCQEMYFQYAKIRPYLSGFQKEMGLPE